MQYKAWSTGQLNKLSNIIYKKETQVIDDKDISISLNEFTITLNSTKIDIFKPIFIYVPFDYNNLNMSLVIYCINKLSNQNMIYLKYALLGYDQSGISIDHYNCNIQSNSNSTFNIKLPDTISVSILKGIKLTYCYYETNDYIEDFID